ncbi:MAG: hypothetical protein R2818_07760 [Flavobacteriales bacterium]
MKDKDMTERRLERTLRKAEEQEAIVLRYWIEPDSFHLTRVQIADLIRDAVTVRYHWKRGVKGFSSAHAHHHHLERTHTTGHGDTGAIADPTGGAFELELQGAGEVPTHAVSWQPHRKNHEQPRPPPSDRLQVHRNSFALVLAVLAALVLSGTQAQDRKALEKKRSALDQQIRTTTA